MVCMNAYYAYMHTTNVGCHKQNVRNNCCAHNSGSVHTQVLAWSFHALLAGTHPTHDHLGNLFAPESWAGMRAGRQLHPAGYVGVVHGIAGDLSWLAERLRLPQLYPNHAQPCAFCLADREAVPFKDLSASAAWVGTVLVPPQPLPSTSALWRIPGTSIFSIRLDWLHTYDLGVLSNCLASCFCTFVHDRQVRGRNNLERTATLWARIRELYSELRTPTRLSRLTLTMFTATRGGGGFPTMSTKAAENRHMLPVVARLCAEFSSGSPRDLLRLRCAENLLDLQRRMAAAGTHLTGDELNSLKTCVFAAMDAYSRLAAFSTLVERRPLFNVVNKMHFLLHLILRAGDFNPQLAWTYGFEDLVGRAQKVAKACSSGRNPIQVSSAFMTRYRRVLHAALADKT
jgi:hypothetical protein